MVKARTGNKQKTIQLEQEKSTIQITIGKTFKDPNTGLNIVLCPNCFNKMSLFLWQGTKRCLGCGQGIGKVEELNIDYLTPQTGIMHEDPFLHVQFVVCPICNYKNTLSHVETNKTCTVCQVIFGTILNQETGELTTLEVSELLAEYENKYKVSDEDEARIPLIHVNSEEKILQSMETEGIITFWNQKWHVKCNYCGFYNSHLPFLEQDREMRCSHCEQRISTFKFDEESPTVAIDLTPLECPECGKIHDSNEALKHLLDNELQCDCGFSMLEYLRDPAQEGEFYQRLFTHYLETREEHHEAMETPSLEDELRLCPSCYASYPANVYECKECDLLLDPRLAKEDGIDPFSRPWSYSYTTQELESLIEIPPFVLQQIYCPTCDSYHDKTMLLAESLHSCPLDDTNLTNNDSICEDCSIQYPSHYTFCMQCGKQLKLMTLEPILPTPPPAPPTITVEQVETRIITIYCKGCLQSATYENIRPRFCKHCGNRIEKEARHCSSCDIYYPLIYKYCQKCGSSLQVQPIPLMTQTVITKEVSIFCHHCRQSLKYYHVPEVCYNCFNPIEAKEQRYCENCKISYPTFYKFCQECGSQLIIAHNALQPIPKLSEIPIYCESCQDITMYDHLVTFCKKCGNQVRLESITRCPRCLTFNTPHSKFCKNCGHQTVDWIPNPHEMDTSLLQAIQETKISAPSVTTSSRVTPPASPSIAATSEMSEGLSRTVKQMATEPTPSQPPEKTVVSSSPQEMRQLPPMNEKITAPVQPAESPSLSSSSTSTSVPTPVAPTRDADTATTTTLPPTLDEKAIKNQIISMLKQKKYKILDPSELGYKIEIIARKGKRLIGIQVSENQTTAMMDELLFMGFPGKWAILVMNENEDRSLGPNQHVIKSLEDVRRILETLTK